MWNLLFDQVQESFVDILVHRLNQEKDVSVGRITIVGGHIVAVHALGGRLPSFKHNTVFL